MLASLGGEVFLDADGNGVRDAGEIGQPDIRVYIDANDNSRLDGGELSTLSDAAGQYQFDNLVPGSYAVRILTPGAAQSSPTAYLGTGYPFIGSGNGTNPTQLYQMSLDGDVTFVGTPTGERIHGLVRTNDGSIIGVNFETDAIYSIDPVTGQESLLALSGEDVAAGLAHDPATDTIYTVAQHNGGYFLRTVNKSSGLLEGSIAPEVRAINFGSTFYDFDTGTGIATEVERQTLSPFASTLDRRSDGAIFGLQGNSVNQYSFPGAGSTATELSTLSQPIEAISFDSSDQLFGVTSTNSSLHLIDPNTGVVGPGVAITVAGSPLTGVTGFDIGPDGTHYLVDSTHLYTFDPLTGVATQSANRALPSSSPIFTSLSVGDDGSLFASLFDVSTPIARIDPASGLATRLGDSPDGSPYASVVVSQALSGLTGNLNGISDLTFDSVNQRIVGFANDSDQFFQFTTDGVGSLLAQPERPLHSWSLAFNGTEFIMFDQDDPLKQAAISVDPDTGTILPAFTASRRVPSEALFHAKTGDVAQRVDLLDIDLLGFDFGVLDSLPVGVPQPNAGLFINELLLDPLFGSPDTDQYVELRGPAGGTIADGTYLVVVDEDNTTEGVVHGIFDLSSQRFGQNGFLVLLQQNHAYTVDPASAVLESTAPGFGGLPGGIYNDSHASTDNIDFILGANSYMLIRTGTPPQLGDDIDADSDGLIDPAGVASNWTILDSVSHHPTTAISDQSYASIVLRGSTLTNPLTVAAGVQVVEGGGSGYVGRIGDSVGSSPDDWIFSTAIEAIADPNTGRTTVYELESGIFGVPVPPAFNGRDLDHIGASNFNGGVSGTVAVLPPAGATDPQGNPLPPSPVPNVTILADTNDNGMQDLLAFGVDPDDANDPNNPVDGNGNPILTNTYPGVTVTTADVNNNIVGFDVTAEFETNFPITTTNRIFAHTGIDFWPQGQRLRFDFYHPVSEVSIEAIGSELGINLTYGRLDAYDANGQLIDFARSGPLFNSLRETITVGSSQADIAYAVAYSDEDFGSAPFGRFDNLSYRQLESTAVTDALGQYEIKNLFPGTYAVRPLDTGGLLGGQSRQFVVLDHENYLIDFGLRNNDVPVINSTFRFIVDENLPVNSQIGVVSGMDPDGQPVKYAIETGQEFGLLIDEDTGVLSVGPAASLNFEADSEYSLTVSISDSTDLMAVTEVTVQLNDINEPPEVQTGLVDVAEGTEVGTIIGQIAAHDPDVQLGQTVNYQVIGGSGVGIVQVDAASGRITVVDSAALDFESLQSILIRVAVSDDASPPASTVVDQLITIIDQNDRPVITTDTISIFENSSGLVGTISVHDDDLGQATAVEITGGSGADLFEVADDGTLTTRSGTVLDFELQNQYTLAVRAADNGTPPLAVESTVMITILDLNEPPQLNVDTVQVGENAADGDLIATLTGIDPDGIGSGYLVSLLAGVDAEDFQFDPATGQLRVASGASLDFETDPDRQLQFEISDPSGNDVTGLDTLLVQLIDQNDPPTLLTDRVIVSELAAPGTVVGKVEVQVREEDTADTVTAEIIGGNAASLFDIDPQTRVLTVAAGATFDADVESDDLILEVRVTDEGGLTNSGSILVVLNDVNEPPEFTAAPPVVDPLASGQPLELVLPEGYVIDPEGGSFEVAIFDSSGTLPPWLRFDKTTRTLTGLPNPSMVGSYALTLRAFEPGPLELFNDVHFTIDVQLGNTPLTNQRSLADVDGNGDIAALDALRVINFMTRYGAGVSVASVLSPFFGFVDVSADGIVTSLDALLVINKMGQDVLAAGEQIAFWDADDRDQANDMALAQWLAESSLF